MFHHGLVIACFLLLAFALSGLARQIIIIDGRIVPVEGIEIDCEGRSCCQTALNEKLKGLDWIIGTHYVTKHDHNSAKARTTCVALVLQKEIKKEL